MIHLFINKNSDKTIILLHGTGADEYDLLSVGELIDKEANLLSFRGDVNENGMNRFFKRFKIGSYDLVSYKEETKKLVNNIIELKEKYHLNLSKTSLVGFSNGANIGLGILQYYPEILNNYILYSPDFIDPKTSFKDLTNKKIFISTSKDDPYSNYLNLLNMFEMIKENNGLLKVNYVVGHQVTLEIIKESKDFIL